MVITNKNPESVRFWILLFPGSKVLTLAIYKIDTKKEEVKKRHDRKDFTL